MKYPKFKRYALIMLTVLLAIVVLGQCLPTPSQANPTTGPPTIQEHLTAINSNMQFIKYMASILTGMFACIIALLVYIWRTTIGPIKSDIKDNEHDIEHVKDNYLSIAAHDRLEAAKRSAT